MKIVKLHHPMQPPNSNEPTDHVIADRVERHDEHTDIHIGDTTWQVSNKTVKDVRDERVYD